MIRITTILTFLAAALAFVSPAAAGDVTYSMKSAGVSCAGSADYAERTVRRAAPVSSVEADPVTHSVTLTFDDDEVTLASIVESLEGAGLSVEEPVRVQ